MNTTRYAFHQIGLLQIERRVGKLQHEVLNNELLGLAERQRDVFLFLICIGCKRPTRQNLPGRLLAGIGMRDAGDEKRNGAIQLAAG